MGAYYWAVLIDHKTVVKPDGYKLMEHAYYNNDSMNKVIKLLYKKGPSRIVWLCDYHEGEITWDTVEEEKYRSIEIPWGIKKPVTIDKKKCLYLVNYDKKEYVDLKKHFAVESILCDGSPIHPLPLLTNSDPEAMGGGDFYPYTPIRSRWKGQMIGISAEKPPEDFVDITPFCYLIENEKYMNSYYGKIPPDFDPRERLHLISIPEIEKEYFQDNIFDPKGATTKIRNKTRKKV